MDKIMRETEILLEGGAIKNASDLLNHFNIGIHTDIKTVLRNKLSILNFLLNTEDETILNDYTSVQMKYQMKASAWANNYSLDKLKDLYKHICNCEMKARNINYDLSFVNDFSSKFAIIDNIFELLVTFIYENDLSFEVLELDKLDLKRVIKAKNHLKVSYSSDKYFNMLKVKSLIKDFKSLVGDLEILPISKGSKIYNQMEQLQKLTNIDIFKIMTIFSDNVLYFDNEKGLSLTLTSFNKVKKSTFNKYKNKRFKQK